MRCRKTGRYLQHKHFENIVKTGGLNSLPIVKAQGASVRTGTAKSGFIIIYQFYFNRKLLVIYLVNGEM